MRSVVPSVTTQTAKSEARINECIRESFMDIDDYPRSSTRFAALESFSLLTNVRASTDRCGLVVARGAKRGVT